MSINPLDGELLQTYVPLYDVIPEDWENARPFFVEALKRISTAINVREIASFLDQELLTGGQFIPGANATPQQSPDQYRDILRKVIVFGALPNATTKSIAHGIAYDNRFSLINLWLAATDPIGLTSFSLQYYSIAAGDIILSLTNTNVVVTTASDYSAYTRCWVFIEYVQQL